ncbi:tyrosyl-tRNA synthetase [Roseibium hamelinense]|uniref:Tyrosine--tRNA ligase n=1 Tax=Roseibium hamelinense TaxID=150831 RepID=A0A562T221_9HYPH|nr:tyrosine--tRNA ligase [Roseibium hamelinense]MTI42922.1 tyrosine--tRNA ligase [Roseibium hamelinense]TWI87642.1 tyrosyl-tRNA synthetase [Roseibium hamelinense]
MSHHMIEAGKPATKLKSEAVQVLLERGLINQCTDLEALDTKLSEGPVTAYAGFDATAGSLHVGHLMPLMTLRWLQRLGHRPIVVLGGGTSQVGDPSFRNEARPLLEQQQIAANIAGIRRSVERLVDMSGQDGALLVDNAEWLNEFKFLEFLRDYGSQFTVNRMMSFDSVKSRLDAHVPLTVLEFCYMMLQAVDFLELSRRHDCTLQIGGSDQWGNIVNGVELGRKGDGRQLFGLTVPLLTTANGSKMGKTAAGAVWLHPEHLSPFGFWQFWRNTADADVPRFLRLFTDLPISEVDRLSTLQGAELNEAKKILATQVTNIVHGPEDARAALEQGDALFAGGQELAEPTHRMDIAQLAEGLGLLELVVAAGFAGSNGEARRLVEAGGVRLNGIVVEDPRRRIASGDLLAKERLALAVGKRRKALIAFD